MGQCVYRYRRREKRATEFLKLVHTFVLLLENVSSIHNISVCVYMIYSDFSTDVLKFYNSQSLLHSREVFYSFKIIPPESEFSGAIIDETESADPTASEGVLTQKSTIKHISQSSFHYLVYCRILHIVRQTQVANLHSLCRPYIYITGGLFNPSVVILVTS